MWGSTDDNFAVKTPQLRTEGRPHRKVTVTVLIAILGKACFQGWPPIGVYFERLFIINFRPSGVTHCA